ncbi:hypothetical protein E2C01_082560 [Portunus trituberculatus]|uniref:Uncharacterized protein n=1 Tax=Portunus trituberculatus TaxID=210409 RepID=A0A5B7J442_PORTR|nr:hypothetical protein [Portunus trituberculatus]
MRVPVTPRICFRRITHIDTYTGQENNIHLDAVCLHDTSPHLSDLPWPANQLRGREDCHGWTTGGCVSCGAQERLVLKLKTTGLEIWIRMGRGMESMEEEMNMKKIVVEKEEEEEEKEEEEEEEEEEDQ